MILVILIPMSVKATEVYMCSGHNENFKCLLISEKEETKEDQKDVVVYVGQEDDDLFF